jgi:hypothetical protein
VATEHWGFLKKSDESLGVFYPLHYIVAGYPDMHAARDAESAFRSRGKPVEDVRAVTGMFVAKELESMDEQSWLEKAKTHIATLFGTEIRFLRVDCHHAREGGAFLFVYAPDNDAVAAAKQVFERHAPTYARRYSRIAIEIIVDNPDPLPLGPVV